jgi:RNA polymerase sigma-70 factor (ECF subfamily)
MGLSADKKDLDRFVSSHLEEILRFATRLTGDPDRAEEIVAEALVRVARSWKSFRGEARFRTWLYRIVINVFRDESAARARTEQLDRDVPDPRCSDPANEAWVGELGRLVARRVSALPPRQREVLVLIAYEGLSASEVANVLGISKANVHATLHVARQRLRIQLTSHLMERCDESG